MPLSRSVAQSDIHRCVRQTQAKSSVVQLDLPVDVNVHVSADGQQAFGVGPEELGRLRQVEASFNVSLRPGLVVMEARPFYKKV
jgi:hypothetical protein